MDFSYQGKERNRKVMTELNQKIVADFKKFKDTAELLQAFPTEQDCIDYLEYFLWGGKMPTSPFDPTSKVFKCKKRKNWYKCENTNKYFSAKSLTVFRNSKLPLIKWFQALHLLLNDPISSHKLIRQVRMTQKTAWFVLHRLRRVFKVPILGTMLKGVVEIDEAFLGGSNPNRHWDKKAPKCQGRSWKDKIVVWAAVERGSGNMVAEISPDTKLSTLEPMAENSIEKGSTINSDEWYRNSNLSKNYNHQIVNHGKGQYAKGKVSVNAVENRWSHLKPMIRGTHRGISRKHAQKYIDGFVLRNNTRNYSIEEKFALILSSSIGKNITYRELIA